MRITNKHYPENLQNIFDPPKALYLSGKLNKDADYISIVGSRTPSSYGYRMAYVIANKLARLGVSIVSGLAFGIDAVAHKACMDAGMPTVAVLASSVDYVTPRSNQRLANQIVEKGGVLLSEYQNYDSAHKYRFLQRNRIISGLSRATIVIEAAEKSGALITADHAFEQNREVYVLLGDLDRPLSAGCYKQIKATKAQPILGIDHLMQELKLVEEPEPIKHDEKYLLDLIGKREKSFDQIMRESNLELSVLNSLIMNLEIKGVLIRTINGFKVKSKSQ
ncbi:DNA-protecting protein DprA [Candidatus Peregrinibacteria bacterium]|nr:DNA-protecting protein DprA [Candidatus Peregrinibacteria bacterium]